MNMFKNMIIKSLPDSDNSATRLRLKFIGSILDLERLEEIRFIKISEDKYGYTIWHKLVENNSHRISINLGPNGTLCDIRIQIYIDLTHEGLGSPYGWYQCNTISNGSETDIANSLSKIVMSSPPEECNKEWTWHIERLPYDSKTWDGSKEKDFIICCYANGYIEEQKDVAAVLSIALVRHIDLINNPLVTTDLVNLCGRLRMIGECSKAIKRVLYLDKERTAEGWTNIGAVLCDDLDAPEPALNCFRKAIEIDPKLYQPRQCVWVAGQKMVQDAIMKRKFTKAISVFEDVSSLGDEKYAEHGIWTFTGLAYEHVNQIKTAKMHYRKALSIENSCNTTLEALERLNIKDTEKRNLALNQQLNQLNLHLEYSHFEEDDRCE